MKEVRETHTHNYEEQHSKGSTSALDGPHMHSLECSCHLCCSSDLNSHYNVEHSITRPTRSGKVLNSQESCISSHRTLSDNDESMCHSSVNNNTKQGTNAHWFSSGHSNSFYSVKPWHVCLALLLIQILMNTSLLVSAVPSDIIKDYNPNMIVSPGMFLYIFVLFYSFLNW